MDPFRKQSGKEGQLGRMIRNMSLHRMIPLQSGTCPAATDVYESDDDVIIFMDVSGINPENLSVVAHEMSVTVSGERQLPVSELITRIHQLEIERGCFERTIPLPKPVDTAATSSTYKNGFLIIKLPKLKHKGKIQIKVT